MDNNFQETAQIVKTSAKETIKKHKWLPIVGAIIIIIAALLFALAAFLKSDAMVSKLVYSFVPEEVYIEELHQTYYSELNEDYDSSETGGNLQDMFKTYYIRRDAATGTETKVYVEQSEDIIDADNGRHNISLIFLGKAGEKYAKILGVIKIVAAVLIVGLIALVIYLWYRSYTKREAAEREKKYKNKNQNRHNKK